MKFLGLSGRSDLANRADDYWRAADHPKVAQISPYKRVGRY